jgi:rfaE bifunctional protein nucleotidyltransferase chain/domain
MRRPKRGRKRDSRKEERRSSDNVGTGTGRRGPRLVKMGRIVNEDQLADLLGADRAEGRTVALANGCFDVLHVGHTRYLAGAAAEADRLVVAVNDDQSVHRLKGEGRPILSAADRAEMVAALDGVDYVVTFSDPDVNRLLKRLKPDVHCKGTDYTVETVPERQTVLGYGGRLAIVGDPKDHSTRVLLSAIKAHH